MKRLLRIGRGPVTRFALLSFFVTAATTAALVVIISYHFRQHLLEREWTWTAAYVAKEAHSNLSAAHFLAPHTPEAQARFTTFYEDVILLPELVRLKIYDAEGTVIWSDEPRLVGQRFLDNPQLRGALAGRIMVKGEIGERKGEHVYEPNPSLVEVYVPIVFQGSRVVGVVEAYKSPDQVFARVRSIKVIVAATALLGASLLYLALVYIVRRSADRVEARVKELFQFVEPTKQRQQRLDLNSIVSGVLQMMAGRLSSGDVKLIEHLTPGLPPITGDAMLLQQAILNILENARDAVLPAGGAITIVTDFESNGSPGERVFLEVSDTGAGIPPDTLRKIFEPFFTTKPKGTGLGLALAKKFIEANDGSVKAGNAPGGGAVFHVTFETSRPV